MKFFFLSFMGGVIGTALLLIGIVLLVHYGDICVLIGNHAFVSDIENVGYCLEKFR